MHDLERIRAMNDRAYQKWLQEQNNMRSQLIRELSENLSKMAVSAEPGQVDAAASQENRQTTETDKQPPRKNTKTTCQKAK